MAREIFPHVVYSLHFTWLLKFKLSSLHLFIFLFIFFCSNHSGETIVFIDVPYNPNSKLKDFYTIYEALYINRRLPYLPVEVVEDNSTYYNRKLNLQFFLPNVKLHHINLTIFCTFALLFANISPSAYVVLEKI